MISAQIARIRMGARRNYGATPDTPDEEVIALYAREVVHRALTRAGCTDLRPSSAAIRFAEVLLRDGATPSTLNWLVSDIARLASGLRPVPAKKPRYVLRDGRWFIRTAPRARGSSAKGGRRGR